METKRKFRFLFIALFFIFTLSSNLGGVMATPVSIETGQIVAESWMKRVGENKNINEGIVLQDKDGNKIGYLFNFVDGGFVVVPEDDIFEPIKAWSKEGSFRGDPLRAMDMETLVRKSFRRQRSFLAERISQSRLATHKGWGLLLINSELKETQENLQVIGPLLTTKWDQDEPYSNYCPIDTGTMNQLHSATGCVTTAIAQIMRYWQWPLVGLGSKCYFDGSIGEAYSCGTNQTLCADFEHEYDWKKMTDTYTSLSLPDEEEAVARLMADVGVASEICYSYFGSPGYSHKARDALVYYFSYGNDIEYLGECRDNFFPIVKEQLDKKYPIYFSSDDHAYVADGYRVDLGMNQTHFNFGWGGQCDGWFTLEELNDFWNYSVGDSVYVYMIINIHPAAPPPPPVLSVSVVGQTVNLSWPTKNADGYIFSCVEYPLSAQARIISADLGVQTTLSATLWSGAAYYVAVQAYNAYGVSDYSNIGLFQVQ